MDDLARVSFLLDFYGGLLNSRQYDILSMHCNEDQSLTEISEVLGITRQGACDNINRAKKKLEDYESKLGLAEKFITERKKLGELLGGIEKLDKSNMNSEVRTELERIKNELQNMLGNL